MARQFLVLFAVSLILPLELGCDGSDDEKLDEGQVEGDKNDDEETGTNSNGNDNTDFLVCETFSTGLESIATRVVILEDRSLSMNNNNKWQLAKDAIQAMVTKFDNEIAFGLDLFSINGGALALNPVAGMCRVGQSVLLDVDLSNADKILQILNNRTPGNATPLLLAMQNFTNREYAPTFMDGLAQSYLVIISDGMDTCGANGVFNEAAGASAQQLATVAENLRKNQGVKTIVIGFGEGADPEQLDAIAAVGGTRFKEHFNAADGEELAKALQTIAQTVVVSCEFNLGDIDRSELNLDLVNVSFDGALIPRDDDCAKGTGWKWMDKQKTAIQFCEKACKKLESESVDEVKLQIACSVEDVHVV
jgi:hypothetical protein